MDHTIIAILAFIIGCVIGVIGFGLVGVIFLGKDLYSISERLNSLYSQNLNVLSNINNPAVSGLMNTIAQQEHGSGVAEGVEFVFLALYKMYVDGDFLDFDSILDGVNKTLSRMNSDQEMFDAVQQQFAEYNKLKDEED